MHGFYKLTAPDATATYKRQFYQQCKPKQQSTYTDTYKISTPVISE